MNHLCRRLLPFLALLLIAAGKKQPPLTVRFYTEANAKDTSTFAVPVQLQYPPRTAYVSKIAAISERDVVAIYPFQAADGSLGCAFKLDEHGTIALDTLSVEHRGTALVAVVNGRQVIDMLIDKHVTDGIVVIPSGLAPQEILSLKKTFKTIGSQKERQEDEERSMKPEKAVKPE